ncbi:hypothetical protein THASP1DRAFT_12520 [Thamnocephalis sphaerospora]|uniref:ubiquitinyl hydrolase 1 n=1 Tax=Thamnocephalis sphaerospora TaxID=78915 RepID=A0A4P9XWF9_9FUNG|nr:hypothetical protein THASP1DRAFT_12520 [Thamnocephalis sphaerospora]|eukprot:RKP10673.1 hypothetical protein THASP1DRAFT_12520 [Thamnocephalis sphaerospora]
MQDYKLSFNAPLIQPRGMLNSKNTCYMNAILQPLGHCPPFFNLFRDVGRLVAHSFNSKTPLVDSMYSLRNAFATLELGEPFAPEYIYETLRQQKKFDSLRGRQEDADEFLGSLLDALHEEFVASSKGAADSGDAEDSADSWLEVGKKQKTCQTRTMDMVESPVSKMFWGRIRSVLQRTGSRDSATLEPFRSLHLDISSAGVNSIGDALANLTSVEELDGMMGIDGSMIRTTKQSLLEKLPPVLVLHLKRFHYDPVAGIQKLRRRIAYDMQFRVRSEMVAPALRGKLPEYTLIGVVYHHGMYAAGGHYTCDVRRQNGQWIRMDDTSMQPVSESDVCKTASSAADDASAAGDDGDGWSTVASGGLNGWSRTTEGDAYLLFYVDSSLLPESHQRTAAVATTPRKRAQNAWGERK